MFGLTCALMKLTVQIRLLPNPAQEAALRGTLRLANDAANLVAEVAAGLPQGRERPRLPGPQVVPARHLRSDSTSSAASSRTRRGGSEWWSSGLTPPTPRRPARLAGTWTGTTEWIRPGSVAGRAASLSMPTGTQPATSPCVVQRAGLPSTSRTRTGAISPELQLNHSWFESLARPRSSCEPSRAPIHSLKSWPARLPIVPPGGHPRRPRKRGDLVEMRRWQERATGSRVRGVALALGGTLLLAGCAGGSYTGATVQSKPVHHLYIVQFIVDHRDLRAGRGPDRVGGAALPAQGRRAAGAVPREQPARVRLDAGTADHRGGAVRAQLPGDQQGRRRGVQPGGDRQRHRFPVAVGVHLRR